MSDVQQQVEALAARLDCAVLVEDAQHHPLWWSAQGEIDAVRSRTILQREPPPEAAALVTTLGLAQAIGPVRTPAVVHLDMAERWCVPLRSERQLLGYLWVSDAEGKVSAEDLSPVLECAGVAASTLARARPSQEERERRRAGLLMRLASGPDPAGAGELIDLERLPGRATVAVDAPVTAGGWTVPSGGALADGFTVHVDPAVGQLHTSGPPLPLPDLAVAVHRAACTLRALRAGARLSRPCWDALGSWHLIVAAPPELSPGQLHPGADILLARARPDLLATARCVLDNGGDVTFSAEQLHIHRTTLYYRLERIEALTGVNLRRAAGRDDLHLALRLAAYRMTA